LVHIWKGKEEEDERKRSTGRLAKTKMERKSVAGKRIEFYKELM